MIDKKKTFTEEDRQVAKRRDDIVRAMIAMPPAPNKPKAKKTPSRPKSESTKPKKKPAK